ncbi:DNA topoisomerase-1 [Microbacterium ginsengiterrae]|uniref:DNA topoisomerase 1 n=1 Tax=Microbacterium ginsengiterrae TaxID=546115 RepID=A0A7W9FC27_9MICO|nr:type I DNA topoisomerase [Microbacterium ginsengiterrae]MBB5742048.1 DNA topoisomerase-1 [Microbacterium ginsengiterrae]
MAEGKKLVIVESPTKMRSIQGYLGDDYEVLSSVGHIRDLADKKDIPAADKEAYGKYSIDIDNGFDPYYVVSDRKTKTVAELKRALKNADEVLLATDEDREGEAIAWHLLETLKPKVPVKRMVFHEITKDAIQAAVGNTRELDLALVDAQETRRILDRLYGWDVSPVLWYKVKTGLSAGRVQSAATRMIVERERERMAFVSADYWDVEASAASGSSFRVRLVRVDGGQLARGTDFDDTGKLKKAVVVLSEEDATALAHAVDAAAAGAVTKVEAKPGTRSPYAPFTTSTLQQEAGRKLSMSAKQAMSVAQRLYEKGFITYMRTDSVALSTQAVQAARSQAVALYGDSAVPLKPRVYKSKSKNAQEAHEAIRPSGENFRKPASVAGELDKEELRLYDLIWKRTVASQMADAKYETTTVTISVDADGRNAEFTASGTVYTFKGFLDAYEEGKDEKRDADADSNQSLPAVAVGDRLTMSDAEAKGHKTNPKPRYTEASLVKALEEHGIGRPSTFASIIGTVIDRGYATKRGQALVPTWMAFSVVRLLEEHFSDLIDYDFTAALEDDLDAIARGEQKRVEWLHSFYFGSEDHVGLRQVVDNLGEIDARALNSTRITDNAVLRFGKYGPYLEVIDPSKPDERGRIVNVPEDLAPDELTPEKAQELIDAPVAGDRVLGENPENGRIIVVKDGRYGPYVQENLPEDDAVVDGATGEVVEAPKKKTAKKDAPKPRTGSLFRSMSVDTIDLDTALALLSLPRVVGTDPETGDEITAQNGRYGPYLKKGTDSRSLESEQQIFDVTLEQALEIYKQPKYGAGSRRASSALAEFDADPVSGKPIRVRDGRFGPYVTDGETNVTIPRGQKPEDITFEIAVQMLADKRAKGPAPKRGAKKAPAKKAAATKAPAKKTAAAKPKTDAEKAAARSAAAKKAAATRAAKKKQAEA